MTDGTDKSASGNAPLDEAEQRRLGDVRRRVQDKYLGRASIHGVGLRAKDRRIRIYAGCGDSEQARILDEIRKEAAPFDVEVVVEEAPAARQYDK